MRHYAPLRYATALRLKTVSFDPKQLNQEHWPDLLDVTAQQNGLISYLLSLDWISFSYLPLCPDVSCPISMHSGHAEMYSWFPRYAMFNITHMCICSCCSLLRRKLPTASVWAGSSPQIWFIWTSLYFSFKFEPTFKNQKIPHEILDFWLCLENGSSGCIVSAFIRGGSQLLSDSSPFSLELALNYDFVEGRNLSPFSYIPCLVSLGWV